MMTRTPILALAAVAGLLWMSTGCATRTEEKFSRGVRNVTEFARLGEIRRSVEQTTLFDGPDKAYSVGVIRGLNKTLVRTGVGAYEMVTAPFPPYGPVMTHYIPEDPAWPASFRPDRLADQTMATDTHMGFSGGDIAPMVPGSRFRVFDN
jgi:putative exosortase-associated protein (TIGR04073 family)